MESKARGSQGQRCAVFVDVQNMFYSAKHLHQSKLDYAKVLSGVVGPRSLVRAIAYIVQKPDVNQSGFHEALTRFGFELKIKELRIRPVEGSDRTVAKGSWEVGIAVDAVQIASRIDTLILISGNGEYTYLAKTLRSLGVRVEVVSFERSTSGELINSCDQFIPIRDDWMFTEKKFQQEYDDEEYEDEEEEEEEEQPVGATVYNPDVPPSDSDSVASKFLEKGK